MVYQCATCPRRLSVKFVPGAQTCKAVQNTIKLVLIPADVSVSITSHLVLDSLAVFRVADHSELQLGHLLHLAVHVNLLQ